MKELKLLLSYQCNLNCSYCYQDLHDGEVMSYEVLDKIIEQVKNEPKEYIINFFGGEPTIHLDRILYFIDATRDYVFSYGITTNGTNPAAINIISERIGYPINNLMSNKSEYIPEPINSNSSFKLIITREIVPKISRELIRYLLDNFISLYVQFNLYEPWTEVDLPEIIRINRIIKEEELKITNTSFKVKIDSPFYIDGEENFVCAMDGGIEQFRTIMPDGSWRQCHRGEFDFRILPDGTGVCMAKEKLISNLIKLPTEERAITYGISREMGCGGCG